MVEPRIGVITALEKECAAVLALLESVTEVDVPGSGAGRHYYVGEVPARDGRKHTVALCRAGMGNNIAAIHTTLLFQHFPTIRSVIMVGIAGGVPNPGKAEEHVRLGDIVVSDEGGVRQYDFGKDIVEIVDSEANFEFKERDITRSPGATLVRAVQDLTVAAWGGDKPWIKYINDACRRLSVLRPPAETDILLDTLDPTKVVDHPNDPARIPGQPRLFSGKIASGNVLLKNPLRRDYLRKKFRVRAVEMESAGIADAAWLAEKGYLVVRGISDYCDSGKNDIWQEYAAIVAAAYARALIESLPTPDDGAETSVPSTAVNLEQYLAAVKVLSETDPYISLQGLAEVPHIPLLLRHKNPQEDEDKKPANLDLVINENRNEPHLMFTANGGAGKSTLLKEIARTVWHSPESLGLHKRYLPMLIRLSAVANTKHAVIEDTLRDAIYNGGEFSLPGELPKGFFSAWPNEVGASWFLLFDGLDEVSSDQWSAVTLKLLTMLETLTAQGHRIAVTSRIGEFTQPLESKLTTYELLGFTPKQQREFGRSCFGSDADKFLNEVKGLEADDLRGNPLLFRIAAIVFNRDRQLVRNKSALYERFVQVWLDQATTLGLKDELRDLHELGPSVLEQLALQMTEQPDDRSSVVLSHKLASYLRDTLLIPLPQAVAKAKRLVNVLGTRSGVFVEVGNVCDWAHGNFRDHLAGRALNVRLLEQQNDYATVLGNRPLDIHWAEVIRTLVQINPTSTELLNWIASEGEKKADAQSALLVHYYWTQAGKQNDPQGWKSVVDVLLAGLLDMQAGLRGPQKIKDALVEMGERAVPDLLAALKRLNGLQRELIPDWEGKQPPDFHAEHGEKLWHGYRQRSRIIDVLGRIKDARTFDDILSLLEPDRNDSYRRDLREPVQKALMCIGQPVVKPLLLIASDANNSAEKRRRALVALKRIGRRNEDVTNVLDKCLTEGLSGNRELLKSALFAAAGLRDRKQSEHAAEALKLDNQEVVTRAADFFSAVPEQAVVNDLVQALQKWDGMEPHPMGSGFGIKALLTALSVTGDPLAKRIVRGVVSSSLRGRRKLEARDALRESNNLSIDGLPKLFLSLLLYELRPSQPAARFSDLIDALDNFWRPADLDELARVTRRIEDLVGTAGVDKLVSRYLEADEADVERSYADENGLVQVMAKCQVREFAEQVGRLLDHAEWDFLRELGDILWIAGDVKAEPALLRTLQRLRGAEQDSESPSPELYHVIRALGTCGTTKGADEVIETVLWNPRIDPAFSDDVLRILLGRGMVNPKRLMMLAESAETHEFARNFFVEALGCFDAPAFGEFFGRKTADEDQQVRINAAHFLGWSTEPNAVSLLIHLLETTDSVSIAEASAASLVRLEHSGASTEILKAIERLGPARSVGLIREVARLRNSSVLKYLKSASRSNEWIPWEHGELLASVGEFYDQRWAQTILEEWLENTGIGYDTGQQRWAFNVLAKRDPNKLFTEAVRLYDESGLEDSARNRLVALLRRLFRGHPANPHLALPLLKRLLCDEDLWVRESVAEDLVYLSSELQWKIYEELSGVRNDWAQACGVYSLGFWDSDETEIKRMRYSPVYMVRYFADRALTIRQKRPHLRRLADSFVSSEGAARVSSYLGLVKEGSEQMYPYLDERVENSNMASVFLGHMANAVESMAKKRREKLMKEEKELFCGSSRQIVFSE